MLNGLVKTRTLPPHNVLSYKNSIVLILTILSIALIENVITVQYCYFLNSIAPENEVKNQCFFTNALPKNNVYLLLFNKILNKHKIVGTNTGITKRK